MVKPPTSEAERLEPERLEKKQVVRQLLEVSRLLEVLDEPYRASAYAGAARRLEAYEGDFASLLQEARLTELRGIGPGVAAELAALKEEPQLPLLAELYAQVPEGVRGLFRVSGLGPKKVRALWQSGVADLSQLVAAAQDGRLTTLRGFGAKSAATVSQAAVFALEAGQRMRLDEAEACAARFEALFGAQLPYATLTRAGELRRALETVGTLVFVVSGVQVSELRRALASLALELSGGPSEPDTGGLGGLSTTFEGRRLELWRASDETFGAVLALATGAEAFRKRLVAEADGRGLSLSGAGLFRGAERLAVPTEAELFARLELLPTPPERREEAYPSVTPALITEKDVRGLVHNHSSWSDGASSLREMVAEARARGYRYLATADHSRTSYYAGGLSIGRVLQQAQEVARIREELAAEGADFRLLHGLEVDILPDGSLDYPDEVLATLDYAVVSVHQQFTLSKAKQTERIVRAVHNSYAKILGHMTGRLLLRRPSYEVDIEAVITACADTGTVVELNANPRRLDLDWRWLIHARTLGCRFSINPDAHHTSGYDDVRYGVLMARKAGLEAKEIVNTAADAETFLSLLKPSLP